MLLERFYEDGLAQASYLVGCQATGEALVVDPVRDVEQYVAAAEREDLSIVAATETHIHADFLSGVRELGERLGARMLLPGEGGEGWEYEYADEGEARLLRDGDTFRLGNVRFQALHTPGHTPEHVSLLLTDGAASEEP
ncbi:MAG: MBL fold metallo-hydrolase, partial [Gemmatimonadetes bacterium]|nr:MBL fold metallo-hydrolase [Gemmatimonadota bacterium]NIR79240.1 MBL fold metallo-hydrolase [Gemmatimonadota bacterium]NIT87906.1 MBL fold metallo-hydrolase [Gemmatimonadota bacterium]NIU31760.1 MBL fold metallo-hydrolase [Gemmatimonadota bacterium]NIU36375.1 MBL fold metallo-hydrolase [Gemmatimonadota bacterium]